MTLKQREDPVEALLEELRQLRQDYIRMYPGPYLTGSSRHTGYTTLTEAMQVLSISMSHTGVPVPGFPEICSRRDKDCWCIVVQLDESITA